MNNYNYTNHTNREQYGGGHKKVKKESKFLDALVYFIVVITIAMIAPLVYKFADDYANNRISALGDKEIAIEKSMKNRKYTFVENTVDLSRLRNTEFGALNFIAAKVTNEGDVVMFCSSRVMKTTGNEETGFKEAPENVLRIALVKKNTDAENVIGGSYAADGEADTGVAYADGNIIASRRTYPARYNLIESIKSKDYVYKDYADGTFFLSNNKTAFLFDTQKMRTLSDYMYPADYHIYQTALSNNKKMVALASAEGFFVGAPDMYNMSLAPAYMKELIAAVNVNGVVMSARHPSWSGDDGLIYYKLYADENVRNAGVTTTSPGGNEQLTSLNGKNFIFLNNDSVFYYFLQNSETGADNQFRCGYFNIVDKKRTEVMRSQIDYFDINVSSNGTHLAALSRNGNLVKISIIDIRTKKLIYSSLYSEIFDYSFSPDEKNVIIYGRADGKKTLKVISIDWTEE